jgi:AcrR family transcriptional regulator
MTRKRSEKSEQTLAAIMAAGFDIAKKQGLQSVSLTSVAKELGISKGGVALRVGSLDALKNMVLDDYEAYFKTTVFEPAMVSPPGLPRLDALMHLWIRGGAEMHVLLGSMYGHCTFEVDPVHLPLRERLVKGFVLWQKALERTIRQAVQHHHLKAETDPEQLVFEIFGLMMSFMYAQRLSKVPHTLERAEAAYARLLAPYRMSPSEAPSLTSASAPPSST